MPNRGRGGNIGCGTSVVGSFDPQDCYVCGKRSHLARDCAQAGQMSGGTPSYVATTQSSVQRGTRLGRGSSQRARFSGLNIVYDDEGYDYPIDDEGRIYIPMDMQIVSETENIGNTENMEKGTKN